MTKHKIVLFFILGLFLSFSLANPNPDERVEKRIFEVGREALPDWLEDIPKEELSLFGFETQEELTRAEVGTPLKVYTIHPHDIEKYYVLNSIDPILKETGSWYVPILVKGKYRLLMTVRLINGKWEAVGINGAGLASEIGTFFDDFPKLMSLAGISGDTSVKFVRVFQAFSDFMYVQTVEGDHIKLFKSAQIAMDMYDELLLDPNVVLPKLLAKIKEEIR